MTLAADRLCKSFGEKKALDLLSFSAVSGRPLGLLGRNGAGKTTVMRIIAKIYKADSGSVLLDGTELGGNVSVGYLPEERGLYRKSRVDEQLRYFALLRGIPENAAAKEVKSKLELFGVSEYSRMTPETLSKGTSQRVQLALSMLGDPDVLILDEPFSGLDPVNAASLKKIIGDYARRGKIIILSSHEMSAAEDFCRDIVILKNGRCVLSGDLAEIRHERSGGKLLVRTENDCTELLSRFGTVSRSENGLTVELFEPGCASALAEEVASSGAGLLHFEHIEPTLEEIFISCAGDEEVAENE